MGSFNPFKKPPKPVAAQVTYNVNQATEEKRTETLSDLKDKEKEDLLNKNRGKKSLLSGGFGGYTRSLFAATQGSGDTLG
jgi:hypothetical protein